MQGVDEFNRQIQRNDLSDITSRILVTSADIASTKDFFKTSDNPSSVAVGCAMTYAATIPTFPVTVTCRSIPGIVL
ncbi:hypothetical protein TNCV_744071 [Trichonephila clavipes]|nr:hypothetical protein TNCV_744071 [Trichonephila clavipes]